MTFALNCPVCLQPLQGDTKHLECPDRHSYDAAKQGYWNLLLANQKRSKDPGDNAEMVQARRAFLALGHYQLLADSVATRVAELTNNIDARILDMGCGEGYYTNHMQQLLELQLEQQVENQQQSYQLAGLDISKHAVKAACGQNKAIQWLVASGARMPVADSSLDLITVLFSRLMPEEFGRTLKQDAALLIAYPGEDHLLELRELIYDKVRHSGFNPAEVLGDQFTLINTETVRYQFTLPDQTQIQQLLSMTPHGWRINQQAKDRLAQLAQLELTLDVKLARFKRN
ncbi:putative RNA methyltransferase [Amphritea balenae]|uniref:Methyltransferase domain-containing protein n=1 Tax=Amphritea balenae TaxID=452629 RepID=A0A3P1SRG1_9GAMM|nr:methyltransferase domain-containing protein [Amphritea balenae]RRC99680.1 methyltransferase domain-containing protein [Amphritea balenae]GGK78938.1 23S rRNA (guanine(745)-N(1))-methyltransferase [Amphritea balenae]